MVPLIVRKYFKHKTAKRKTVEKKGRHYFEVQKNIIETWKINNKKVNIP